METSEFTLQQGLLFGAILLLLGMLLWNRFRYDLVALFTLLLCLFMGVVPPEKAFIGFSHAAVITVAAIFIVSRGIENTGMLGEVAYRVKLRHKVIWKQVGLLCALVAGLSALMNNVGALALLMPVSLNIARTKNIPRSLLLMPMAFSSLLGGLITLIGTPPNIIISDFRRYQGEGPFTFFDFTPVGFMVAAIGVLFIVLLGWRLLPLSRIIRDEEVEKHELFTVELIVTSKSPLVDKKIAQFLHQERACELIVLVRDGKVIRENLEHYVAKPDDILLVETNRWQLPDIIRDYGLKLSPREQKVSDKDHYLAELVVLPDSPLAQATLEEQNLEEHYGLTIVAISRKGERLTESLSGTTLHQGDAILVKSVNKISHGLLDSLGCIALEESLVRPFSRDKSIKVGAILFVCILAISLGLLRADVAFTTAAVAMLAMGVLSIENAYQHINWPVIVLLGALIPIGEAMETTGASRFIAQSLYSVAKDFPLPVILYLMIALSMVLSNIINNAAVALVFAPIALQLAWELKVSPDPLLMGVAVGASCAFMTPIGHQSNTMVMGPGNYRFEDYLWLGLPLTVLVSLAATGMIFLVWPF